MWRDSIYTVWIMKLLSVGIHDLEMYLHTHTHTLNKTRKHDYLHGRQMRKLLGMGIRGPVLSRDKLNGSYKNNFQKVNNNFIINTRFLLILTIGGRSLVHGHANLLACHLSSGLRPDGQSVLGQGT